MRILLINLALLISLLLTKNVAANTYKIEHLEPSSWWVNMKNNQLQLLVHGKNIAELTPSIASDDVTLKQVHRVENKNYVFIDLDIHKTASPQTVRISFSLNQHVVTHYDYPLLARNSQSNAQKSYGPSDVIYLITPDRFANGDKQNDSVDGLLEQADRSKVGGRHGGDIAGIIQHLDYIHDMGYTQLWLNPVIENNQPSYSYHGYSTTDFYRVDPRFGTNDLYKTLATKASERGIGLIKDVVLNHAGSGHWWHNDLPMSNWYNNQGLPYKGTNHKREALHDPHAIASDQQGFSDGWFVGTMPDLNQRNPFMANYLIQNSIWWVEYANLSGLRVDTYSYPDKAFLTEWTKRLSDEYPTMNIVGEEWTTNPAIVSYWQRGKQTHDGYQSYLSSLMDFPLQDALTKSLLGEEDWNTGLNELYRAIANDFQYPNPEQLVIFPDNHDMSRIYTQLNEDVALFKMALTYMLTTRGIPQLFYGTEMLMSNPGTTEHGVIRTDFPGGWDNDKVNAFTGKGLNEKQRDAQAFIKTLLNWRKTAPAIADGKLSHYAPENGLYVYFRHNDRQTIMVVINKNDHAVAINSSNYHTMVNRHTQAENVITKASISLDKPMDIAAKSAVIFELN